MYELDPALDQSLYQPTKKVKTMRNKRRIKLRACIDTTESQEKVESAMQEVSAAAKKAEVWSSIAVAQDFDCVQSWPGGVPLELEWFASYEDKARFKDKIANLAENNLDW